MTRGQTYVFRNNPLFWYYSLIRVNEYWWSLQSEKFANSRDIYLWSTWLNYNDLLISYSAYMLAFLLEHSGSRGGAYWFPGKPRLCQAVAALLAINMCASPIFNFPIFLLKLYTIGNMIWLFKVAAHICRAFSKLNFLLLCKGLLNRYREE